MKKESILTLLFWSLFLCSLMAQEVPQSFTYQAIVRDAQGQPMSNQSISLNIELLEGGPNGNTIYSEQHPNQMTNQFGLFAVEIGKGNSGDDFQEINWQQADFYIKTGIDSGNGFDLIGTFPILSVPYALLAQRAVEDNVIDGDANPENELQELSFDENTQELSLSKGKNVVTIPIQASDNDGDPQNEIQELSLDNNTLSLTNGGGSVELSSSSSLWKAGDGYIFYPDEDNNETVVVSENNGEGFISINNKVGLAVDGEHGVIGLYGGNGEPNCVIAQGENSNYGYLGLRDVKGNDHVSLTSTSSGGSAILRSKKNKVKVDINIFDEVGSVALSGENENLNCWSIHLANQPNHGYFAVLGDNGLDADNVPDAGMLVDESGNGRINIKGTYGVSNTRTSAAIYVDENDGATVTANLKAFKMPHPEQPGKEIRYASIEGPEAAAYERGTAKLENGTAFIPFSNHFSLVINSKTMTVNLTPLSANTLGLAVIEKTDKGIRVKELMNGTGNFEFDWEAKAVRKGYEGFKVIRDEFKLSKVEVNSKLPNIDGQK